MIQRIAIFEPNSSVLKLIDIQLRVAGFQTILHQETLRRASQLASPLPDLIILGSIRGYLYYELDTIYALRSTPELRAIPLLICTTGYVDDQQISRLQPTLLLSLPFTKAALLHTVNQLLHNAGV